MNSNQLGVAVVLLAGLLGGAALAEDGVSGNSILFGQVAAFTGPAQDLGQGMRQGILAAFDEANRSGGIAGRTLNSKREMTATNRKRLSRPPNRSSTTTRSLP